MAELHKIEAQPPGDGIGRVIDELRRRNEAGELSSVAVAFVDRGGVADHMNSHCPSYSSIIGAIERMKWRIVREAEEE